MNTEKLEKLKKSLDNKFIPDNVKDKIRNEIEKLESEIKSEEMSASAIKKEVAKVEEKVEVAVDKAEQKAESTEPKKGRGRPRKTPATTPVEPKATQTAIKKTAMVVAKTIRKDGEKWNDAMKRANGVMKKEKVEVKKTTKSELDRLLARVRKNKSLMSDLKGVKDLRRDAMRTAKPVGKRMSESGNVYYEYRANKTDRKTYGKYAFAGGGELFKNLPENFKIKIEKNAYTSQKGNGFNYSGMILYKDYTFKFFSPYNSKKEVEDSIKNYLKTLSVNNITLENSPEKGDYSVYYKDRNGVHLHTEYSKEDLVEFIKDVNSLASKKFELGGSVVTDLAGHTSGGNLGLNAGMPLDGFSNTAYTGLVGETGAMSSGEMFMSGGKIDKNFDLSGYKKWITFNNLEEAKEYVDMDRKKYPRVKESVVIKEGNKFQVWVIPATGVETGNRVYANGGGVAMANQQVIDDASQGYVNYYLGQGSAQGIYKDGGGIPNNYEGKSPKEVWELLTYTQKEHFLSDHLTPNQFDYSKTKGLTIKDLAKVSWDNLTFGIKKEFGEHISMGQYAKGGGVRKVGNREYPTGRNWTNDHRHTNKSEEHEVKYTRKGKFLGIFAGGGIMADGRLILRTFNGIGGNKNKTYSLIKDDRDSDGKPYYTLVEKPSGNIMAQGDSFVEVNNVANIFSGSFAGGGSVTNERKHVNKDEDYEVRYSRPRPSRKGYLGKRDFAGGGKVDDDTPKIYVADLEAYNNGRLSGVWLDLTDYSDADELMDAINDFLKTTGGEEYAVHDYENLPSSMYSEYMGVRDFEEIYEMMDLAKENDLPLDVAMEVVNQFDRSALDEFTGVYDSEQDFAEQLVDDIGIQSFNDFQYYLEVSDTDRRLLSQDMADGYVDDIRDEDGGNRLIEEAGLDVEEYEEADSERQDEMLDEAREIVYDEYYNNYFEGLSDPYYFLVEEQGLYDAESFANAGFVRVDYEKLADALEQDYTFVRHDGQIYVFNIR
jgi:antirestriction protein